MSGMRERDVVVIEPATIERRYWRDLWRARELLLILAWRDVSVRYKQTVIGLLWALLRPLAVALVFALVFGRLAQMPSEGNIPYALMVLAGMAAWFLVSTVTSEAADSLVANAPLVGKVYFPRLILPLAPALAALVDFAVTLAALLIGLVAAGCAPDWRALFLPAFVALALLVAIGPGLLLATWNARYRDFRYALPFLLQFGLYVSPVGFSSGVVPERWRFLFELNPVVGVIDGFRWALFAGESPLRWSSLAASLAIGLALLALGLSAFRRAERSIADHL